MPWSQEERDGLSATLRLEQIIVGYTPGRAISRTILQYAAIPSLSNVGRVSRFSGVDFEPYNTIDVTLRALTREEYIVPG